MPLLPEVEEILKDYPADQQALLRPLYERSPELQQKIKEQLVGQRDLSRRYQEVGNKEKAADTRKKEADDLYNKNMDWFRTNSTEVEKLETENATLKTDLEKAKSAAAGAAAAGATPEELTKLNTTVTELQKQLGETQKALKDADSRVEQRFNGGAMWMFQVNKIAREHERSYGESFDEMEFLKFCNENKIDDPKAAYDKMTEQKRIDKQVADKVAAETKRIEGEYQQKYATVPYATGSSLGETGPLQTYINRTDDSPKSVSEATARAAAELMSEGKR